MDQLITPAIWCDGTADEAARFYADVFREGSVVEQVPGYASTVSIHGFRLSLMSGDDQDAPNPSISCILNFDPLLFGGEDQARTYLDELYERLSAGGVLMELGEYPFSPRYAWVRDRFGMTWRLMLTDPAGEPRPFILPSFMFGGTNHANAEEATDAWIALFDDAHRGALRQGDFLMVHAGLLPEWEFEQARDLAHEVEKVLSGPHWQDFLSVMYGNTPDRWSDSLRGDDRLRCIVNGLTRLRYLHADGRMDFKCTEAPADAPEGLIPWFQAPNRRSAGRPIIFGHWSSLGLRLQPDLIALDTGCVWGGSLTAIRLENRQIFQQPCPGRKRGGKD